MGENKEIKVRLSTVVYLFIIVVLVVALGVVYYLGFVKNDNSNNMIANGEVVEKNNISVNEEKTETNNKIENTLTENSSDSKYSEITKELDGIDVLYVTDAIENSNNTYILKGVIYTQYTISHKELSDILDKGSMTIEGKAYTIKNSDNAGEYDLFEKDNEYALYKLKMINSNKYYLETQAQVSDNWMLTNEYKEITVSKDTKCSMAYDYEEKYNTVDDVFKNFEQTKPIETKNPNVDKTFTFKFENGKCVEVISAVTGL